MSRWVETVGGAELCLMCGDRFDGEIRWSWMLGFTENIKLCGQCAMQLAPIVEMSCMECGRPKLEDKDSENICCPDCIRWHTQAPWDHQPFQHRALYVYNPFLQELLAQFKYRGDTELASIFHKKIKKLAGKLGFFHYVTPIPLNEKRHWERGFNQAEALAQCFSVTRLLARTGKMSDKQSKRTRVERLQGLEGAFTLACDRKMLDGKSVLLVDDIYTTGATLRAAAAVLYDGGAKKVSAITVARSVGAELKKNTGTT